MVNFKESSENFKINIFFLIQELLKDFLKNFLNKTYAHESQIKFIKVMEHFRKI